MPITTKIEHYIKTLNANLEKKEEKVSRLNKNLLVLGQEHIHMEVNWEAVQFHYIKD